MKRRTIAIALLVPFVALTAYALAEIGYVGILDYHRHSPAGWQVFTDLVVALVLVLLWLVPEARARGCRHVTGPHGQRISGLLC